MNNTFLLLPKAQAEILDAWEWYEERQNGLGERFKHEVHRKVLQITKNPLLYQLKDKYREAQIDVFPYLIVFDFDETDDIVLIVSVFHMSRNPADKL
jgi:plasmid stabilization system protein ParE